MNPDTTPTPRTDACPHCGSYPIDPMRWECGALLHDLGCGKIVVGQSDRCKLTEKTNEVARLREENADLKQWLNERYKALSEADDENENLRNLLGDLVKITNFYWDNSSNLKPKDWQPFQNILNELDRLAPSPEETKIKVSKRPYYYECGDGCCTEWGEKWYVDGVEVCSGPCEDNRLQQLLDHLGFDATITNENEDGEEVCEL